MKKVLSLVLVVFMIMGMSTIAFAASYIVDAKETVTWNGNTAQIQMEGTFQNTAYFTIAYTIKQTSNNATVTSGSTGIMPTHGDGAQSYIVFPTLNNGTAYYVDVTYTAYALKGSMIMLVDSYTSRTNF